MIHVENLTRYFGELCAVDHINLEILRGEILGLLGPNGAGKTTTLRMLTGFLRPSSGTIRVKDYTIEENSLEIRKLLGYLPESAPLYHDMLVYDYLDYVASIRDIQAKEKVSRIKEMAETCGLREVMHKPIGELSKGYKQRVGLAHAMMKDPEILILDEPTSGLDPNQIIEIREIIKQIGKEKTIIISTHILSEAEATCDRVVIINQGRIVADGAMEDLKLSASGESTVHLSLKGGTEEEAVKVLGAVPGVRSVRGEREGDDLLRVRLGCDASEDIRAEVYQRIKETNWILLELYQETQTLEKIFQRLTREG
ncbi:MAG: ATP-binding cassette domain-containing protein [Deltaproteobacteria bacterium]|nr:ATP-binding cassette domain-containing protein [Deltaproteobacteria bacterium]MBW2139321.1 ATP-binding cassette domain-containing protein [Deltaproteobacteria bacterium]